MKDNLYARTLALYGMYTAAAMMLSYVESFVYLGVPGVKLGLANIFIIFILYRSGLPQAAAISAVRCVLSALLFSSIVSLWYSLAGAALSLTVMCILRKIKIFSPMGVSVAGAVSHNAAQIAVAVVLTEVGQIAALLPVLIISGTVAGTVIGIAAAQMIKRVPEKFTPTKTKHQKKGAVQK